MSAFFQTDAIKYFQVNFLPAFCNLQVGCLPSGLLSRLELQQLSGLNEYIKLPLHLLSLALGLAIVPVPVTEHFSDSFKLSRLNYSSTSSLTPPANFFVYYYLPWVGTCWSCGELGDPEEKEPREDHLHSLMVIMNSYFLYPMLHKLLQS